jgi:hypothetical protein
MGKTDKPHPRLLHSATDGAGIGPITLIRLHPRLDVLRRNQSHRMPQLLQLAPPIVGAATGFQADERRRAVRKPWEHPFARQPTTIDQLPRLVFHVHFKYVLRNVDAHRGTLHDDSSFKLKAG